MTKARILLIGGNYLPEPTGIGKYNGEMMQWLAQQGYKCAVITTYPYYPYWQTQSPYERKSYWYTREKSTAANQELTVFRCPHYIPKNPTSGRRILSDMSYFIAAFFQIIALLFRKKYDFVISVAPPFQLGLLALIYKKVKGAKCIYHIQDLQIDAAKELGMIKHEWFLGRMFRLEKFILSRTDHVSTISDSMSDRVYNKCKKPVLFFPNWVDTDFFHPIKDRNRLKTLFGINPDEKVVLYSGAIGEKQGLEVLVTAAKILAGEKIRFVICGSGPYKEKLITLVQKAGLINILFLPLQPKEKFNDFLNMADLHVVLQKANATDLVMPSKLSTILSVGGLALVTATRKTSLYNIITRYDMGLVAEPENESALVDAIRASINYSHVHKQINARKYAIEFLTMKNVIDRFLNDIIPASPSNEKSKQPGILVTEKSPQKLVSAND